MSSLGRVEEAEEGEQRDGAQQQDAVQPTRTLQGTGVVIENLPRGIDDVHLSNRISTFGDIESIKIEGRRALVVMADAETVPTVVKYMHNSTMEGARLRASVGDELTEIRTRVLFVANYPKKYTTDDDLRDTFGEYGTVNTIRMEAKFAFVEMNSIQQAQRCAKELDGYFMYDNPLSVSLSTKHKVLNEVRVHDKDRRRGTRNPSPARSRKKSRRRDRSKSKQRGSSRSRRDRRKSKSKSPVSKRKRSRSMSPGRSSRSRSQSRSRSRSRGRSRSKSRSKSPSRTKQKRESRSRVKR